MAIRTAKAIGEEVPEALNSSVGALAKISENNSERDVRSVAGKFGLAIRAEISSLKVGKRTIPYIKFSSWVKFLLSLNLWHHLAGLDSPDTAKTEAIWSRFWQRYHQFKPGHAAFQRPGHDFSRTCGLFLHGDEGRGAKKSAILMLSVHSALGYGISTSSPDAKLDEMGLNYLKPTWITRFLLGVLPKGFYSQDESGDEGEMGEVAEDERDVYQALLGAIADDMKEL